MIDVEISLRLAMAVGWPASQTQIARNRVCVPWPSKAGKTRVFSYNDSNVIWRIAERYDAFPRTTVHKDRNKGQWCATAGSRPELIRYADTSMRAVAFAVIAYDEYMKRTVRTKRRADNFLME